MDRVKLTTDELSIVITALGLMAVTIEHVGQDDDRDVINATRALAARLIQTVSQRITPTSGARPT